MIVKPSLAISNSIEFGKKWSSPPSMCKGVLDLVHKWKNGLFSVELYFSEFDKFSFEFDEFPFECD